MKYIIISIIYLIISSSNVSAKEIKVEKNISQSSGELNKYFKKIKKQSGEDAVANKTTSGEDSSISNAVKGYELTGKAHPILRNGEVWLFSSGS